MPASTTERATSPSQSARSAGRRAGRRARSRRARRRQECALDAAECVSDQLGLVVDRSDLHAGGSVFWASSSACRTARVTSTVSAPTCLMTRELTTSRPPARARPRRTAPPCDHRRDVRDGHRSAVPNGDRRSLEVLSDSMRPRLRTVNSVSPVDTTPPGAFSLLSRTA